MDEICTRTKDISFYNNVLSKLGVAEDLSSLVGYAINLARNNASNSENLIKLLFNQSTNPRLKLHYGLCTTCYDDTFTKLELTKQYLGSQDYNGLSKFASVALKESSEIRFCLFGVKMSN